MPDPAFAPEPKARTDLRQGVVYAVTGEREWIYYGQVAPDKSVGFFRRRDRTPVTLKEIVEAPLMAVVTLYHQSVGRALRSGRWQKLGIAPLAAGLDPPPPTVRWPVGTSSVTVWGANGPSYGTQVHDPAIQQFERMAVWDAEYHIPERLTADFGLEPPAWHVGGPIWRERQVAEEQSKRWKGRPGSELPPGYVPLAG